MLKLKYDLYDFDKDIYAIFYENYSASLQQGIQNAVKKNRHWDERLLVKIFIMGLKALCEYEKAGQSHG